MFVARAPILTRKHRVVGYQIRVGRPGLPPADPEADDDVAQVTELISWAGIDVLTNGRPAFVRVNRRSLLEGAVTGLPAKDVVLEVGAGVEADDTMRCAFNDLRGLGYRFALEDFQVTSPSADLASVADYLKVDVGGPQSASTRARTVACFGQGGKALIATGIETHDQVETASQDGFVCLQGFFFEQPVVVSGRQVTPQQVTLLRLLRGLNDPGLSVRDLEELLKHDAAMCYRILQAVNSAAFARRTTVTSMREALVLLGCDMVRRWASLWAVAGLSSDTNAELIAMSTVRARLCELLIKGTHGADAAGEGFVLGVCSLLDAIVGRPMEEVLADLPLSDDTRHALCGAPSPFRDLLDCVVAYERGAWGQCEALARRANVNAAILPGAFVEALRWSRELQQPVHAGSTH
jgi:c-di-GMP phosphodiesterase